MDTYTAKPIVATDSLGLMLLEIAKAGAATANRLVPEVDDNNPCNGNDCDIITDGWCLGYWVEPDPGEQCGASEELAKFFLEQACDCHCHDASKKEVIGCPNDCNCLEGWDEGAYRVVVVDKDCSTFLPDSECEIKGTIYLRLHALVQQGSCYAPIAGSDPGPDPPVLQIAMAARGGCGSECETCGL